MNPISVRAVAFRTYADLALTFPEGVCAITGELAGQPGKSNGSGKSSVANAIDLCLFGAQSRSLADEHNPAFGETMLLELVFEHAGETYRVRRTYSAKGRGSTTVDFEREDDEMGVVPGFGDREDDEVPIRVWTALSRESAAQTQAHLETILGLSRPTFRASSFLAQGDGAAFTNAQPRDRKRILAEVLGLTVWDGLLDKARAAKKTAELRLADVAGMIERAEPELAQSEGLSLGLAQARENEQRARASLTEATARLATARDALAEARGRVERRAGAEKALQSAEAALSELRAGIAQREGSVSGLDARLASRQMLEEVVCDETEQQGIIDYLRRQEIDYRERQRLDAEHARLTKESETLRDRFDALMIKRATVLDGIGAEHCDRCGQILGADAAHRAAESYRSEASEVSFRANCIEEQELVTLNEKISALPAEPPQAGALDAATGDLAASRDARTKLAALNEAQTRRDELVQEIDKMRAGLPERETAVGTARADRQALGPHDPDEEGRALHEVAQATRVQETAQKTMRDSGKEIARLEERLTRLDTLAGEVHLATQERDEQRAELELLATLERAYGPNGIPAFIVENSAIPQIEAEACRILAELGTEYQVELHTQRETKTGGVTDALDIVVYDGNRARPYEGFSGGEKTRIELALRIALAHLLANRRGAESRVLVIDEPDGLDSAGMAALADVLRRLYADGVFEKILLVSHVAELRDAFEASIHVVCENGVSSVEGAREPVPA